MKYVSASVRETAFNCPYCGALAKQNWLQGYAHPIERGETPRIPKPGERDDGLLHDIEGRESANKARELLFGRVTDKPFLRERGKHVDYDVSNMWLNQCFNCNEVALWIYDRMVYPQRGEAPPANPDLPADIAQDYHEASSILDLSPRGAAALIRLSIQKLCKHLGKPGKYINDDIKSLVAEGLDPRVQKALDAVRVIGNSAVHPGQIDLRDDRATAESLFRLLNVVADKMISEPKHVDEVYASLPEEARQKIEKRDGG